jgi:transcriptional regulator of arginine metabolism
MRHAGSVQSERVLSKEERQRLVASLVERKRIGTQQELVDALETVGCAVGQATVSRDIRELGLVKIRDPLGRQRYALPGRGRAPEPRNTLSALLHQFGRSAAAAQNIVVVRSEIGSAPAIARALDRVEHPLVMGTLAGDDTCLVVTPDASQAAELARELAEMIG